MKYLLTDDERPARSELRQILAELRPEAEFREASSGEEAIEMMGSDVFDALFLDMDLGDMLGTTVAAAARKLQPGIPIVFATAYSDYAVKAFEMGVMDYILKPFDPARIAKAVQRLGGSREQPVSPGLNKLPVSRDKKILLLPVEEVIYIETRERGSQVHADSGVYEDSAPIGSFERRLAGRSFFRIHKSYLVNLDRVKAVFPWHGGYGMTMEGGEEVVLPIGRSQFRVLKPLFHL